MTRPRAMQVYLALLCWIQKEKAKDENKNKPLSLATEYFYGKSIGRICYNKYLKRSIARWTGLQHKQIVRYLREFEKAGLIYRDDTQISLDGQVRPQFFLHNLAYLTVKPGEKYLKLKLNGCGLKGFDIYGYIERCIKKDSNPKHPDQLEFKIPRSTRFYRSKAQKNMKNKRKTTRKKRKSKLKVTHKRKTHTVQVMTPMRSRNPDPFYRKVQKTTCGEKNNKNIILVHHSIKLSVPWWRTKLIETDHVKISCGIAVYEKALWFGGKVYKLSQDGKSYEFIAKTRKFFEKKPVEQDRDICSVSETRQRMMSDLGLSQAELIKKLKQNNAQRFRL